MMRCSRMVAALLPALLASACTHAPAPAEIEMVSMEAVQRGDDGAERRLAAWAGEGLPVAQRELALLYLKRHDVVGARALLEQAAHKGDAEAAFQLGELGSGGGPAASWYRQAAVQGHARAALMLGLVLKNGEGVVRDRAGAAHWLGVAVAAGNANAMFLLSNAYAAGDGVALDPQRARALLESAAEREYPAAIQQLALLRQARDTLAARAPDGSRQASKEGVEQRRGNARRF